MVSFYDVVKLQNANNVRLFTHSTYFGLKLIILYTVFITEGFVLMYSLKCIKILHSSIPNIQLMSEFEGEFKLLLLLKNRVLYLYIVCI